MRPCRIQQKALYPTLPPRRRFRFEERLQSLRALSRRWNRVNYHLKPCSPVMKRAVKLTKIVRTNLPKRNSRFQQLEKTAGGELAAQAASGRVGRRIIMNRYLDMVGWTGACKKTDAAPAGNAGGRRIRQELINGLAKSGGHLGPNLGVVELTIALHSVFSTPKDRFVWDVSHQVYVHKILTGRKDRFHTIRQTDGPSTVLLCARRVPTIVLAPGTRGYRPVGGRSGWRRHGTKRGRMKMLSAFSGMRPLTNGISFEALNNISHTTKKFIGILNDNEWSIAKNVGAISGYLNKLITNPSYNKLAREFEEFSETPAQGRTRFDACPQGRGRVQRCPLGGQPAQKPICPSKQKAAVVSAAPFSLRRWACVTSDRSTATICPLPDLYPGICQDLRSSDCDSHPHPERQGLRSRPQAAGKISRARPPYDVKTGETPATKPGTPPNYQDVFGQDDG